MKELLLKDHGRGWLIDWVCIKQPGNLNDSYRSVGQGFKEGNAEKELSAQNKIHIQNIKEMEERLAKFHTDEKKRNAKSEGKQNAGKKIEVKRKKKKEVEKTDDPEEEARKHKIHMQNTQKMTERLKRFMEKHGKKKKIVKKKGEVNYYVF